MKRVKKRHSERERKNKGENGRRRVMPCNYLSFSFHSNRLSKIIICLNGISMYLLINLLFFLYLDICLYTANKNDHLLIYIQLVKILLKLISYFFFPFFFVDANVMFMSTTHGIQTLSLFN